MPSGATAKVVLPNGTHRVGPGTTTLGTSVGTRSSYGATPFLVATRRIPKALWNGGLWGAVHGVQRHLNRAEWPATGYAHPVVGLPAGSVVTRTSTGRTAVRLPDGSRHVLTSAEWIRLGGPAPHVVR